MDELQEAMEYFGGCIADYIVNDFPIAYLTGLGPNAKLDRHHLQRLRDMLFKYDWLEAVEVLDRYLKE